MRRRVFLKRSALAATGLIINPSILTQCSKKQDIEKTGKAIIQSMPGLKFLVLEGTPRERGQIHGKALRTEIQSYVQFITDGIVKSGGTLEGYVSELVDNTGFLDAAKRWTPHLVEEIKGIAEGAETDFKTIFAGNLLDESGWYFDQHKWVNPDYKINSQCSVIGASREGNNPAIVAQNADMGYFVDGRQVLLHIKHADSSLEELIMTLPGVMGVYGMNNYSIGVCLNAVTARLNASSDGLGTIFISRGLLYQKTLDDAIRFITEVKHASGEAYTFGDKERVVCYEGSANKVVQFIPYPGARRVYHTNHPLVNDDLWLSVNNLEMVAPELRDFVKKNQANTETRFKTLEKYLRDPTKPVTVDTVKKILCSHDSPNYPVCRHDERGNITTFSMIMVLKDSPELLLAPGPPCKLEYQKYTF